MDSNYSERPIPGPLVGRKNYYGSGAEWSRQMAVWMFSIFSTLKVWKIHPHTWPNYYFTACAQSGGIPENPESFLSWKLSKKRLSEMQRVTDGQNCDSS